MCEKTRNKLQHFIFSTSLKSVTCKPPGKSDHQPPPTFQRKGKNQPKGKQTPWVALQQIKSCKIFAANQISPVLCYALHISRGSDKTEGCQPAIRFRSIKQ